MDPLFDRDARATEAEAQRDRTATPKSAKPAFAFRWIPILSLEARHRPRILAHLLGLSERDRYLRFGYVASDVQIERYVAREQPFDCAGGFKAEGLGIALFDRIDSGDPTALIGLPLLWLASALRQAGYVVP